MRPYGPRELRSHGLKSIQPLDSGAVRDRSQGRQVGAVGSRRDLTQRDLAILRFAADQFALPMSIVAELAVRHRAGSAGTGSELAAYKPSRRAPGRNDASVDTTARTIAARLETRRLARRERVDGQTWLVPTGRGLAMAADDQEAYRLWRPVAWRLAHVETVARLRLWLADSYPEATWESERSVRRRLIAADLGQPVKLGWRAVDGGLRWPDGRAVGIECELTMKHPHEYAAIVADLDRSDWTGGVWWYAPAGRVAWLAGRLGEARAVDHQVLALPEGVTS
jgi:hypothetical protein